VLRKEFIGLSLLSFFSLWTKRVFGDTIEIPKMETLKRYRGCGTDVEQTFVFDLSPYFSQGWICEGVTPYPSGFAEILDGNGNVYGFFVAAGPPAQEYEVQIKAKSLPADDWTYFLLEFDLTDTECVTEVNTTCCDEAITLRWLGREGGIKQWNFPGVREYNIEVGDANTFKNGSRQMQYSERKNIYTGKRITTKNIDRDYVDFLDELRYSIQVWEVDGTNVIPVVLVNDSFNKYKSTDKFFDISISYTIATEIIMQTQ